MLVQFYNVSKIYPNGVKALDDISLKIERGEFIFLMGQSGAGKSSLIKMLFREELPTRGQIFVASRSIVRMKRGDVPKLRRNMGIVFQDFKLLESKTVAENIAFAMKVVGASGREIKKRVPEVIDMVGLNGKEQSFPTELSGGEQQRVGIARALANHPLMLIADEPTGIWIWKPPRALWNSFMISIAKEPQLLWPPMPGNWSNRLISALSPWIVGR